MIRPGGGPLAVLLLGVAAGFAPGVHATEAAPPDRGVVATILALERLPVVASALHIVAHPDDENAALLVYLSRRVQARTALLTATRGEGGQNLLGPEQAEAMGLLRTGEGLAAARYYGVEQYFTRAYDFGFSKTAEETLAKWPREIVLADIVRVIRTVRPDVVVSRFEGTPRDGHGHHQAIGILTREAFRMSGDPAEFPEQIAHGLRPWQARKLYQDAGWLDSGETSGSGIVIDLGAFDPVIGGSFLELGVLGLKQHRSQDMAGRRASRGSRKALFTLAGGTSGAATPERSLFDGIDTSISGIPGRMGEAAGISGLREDLAAVAGHARAAAGSFRWRSLEAALAEVLAGLTGLRGAIARVEASELDPDAKQEWFFFLRWKEMDFVEAARTLSAVDLEAVADDETVIGGQSIRVTGTVYNRGNESIDEVSVSLIAPEGWQVEAIREGLGSLPPGTQTEFGFSVRVSPDAPWSQPYSYREQSTDAFYRLRSGEDQTLPSPRPVLEALLRYSVNGVAIETRNPVTGIRPDPSQGTAYPVVVVVPALSVRLEPPLAVIAAASTETTREWRAAVTNNTQGPMEGSVRLMVPEKWKLAPAEAAFRCSRESETAVSRFRVTVPAGAAPQSAEVSAVAELGDRRFSTWAEEIAYPHISEARLYRPAVSRVAVLDLAVPRDLSVGYILGTQDEVPQALNQLGINPTLLGPDDLAFGDLGRFDCIVAGVRAYAVRPDLGTNNQRLLEYVRNGGVFIAQYNKISDWNPSDFAPYPARYVGHDRITVEDSPVEMLIPGHPLFSAPNRITAGDFEGWVQERGLYFWSEWDPRYTALLSGHDPGEPPKRGGMLIAEDGRGLYVYTAYSWFRQLPAGVPGAYRLFANLISLPRTRQPSAPANR